MGRLKVSSLSYENKRRSFPLVYQANEISLHFLPPWLQQE